MLQMNATKNGSFIKERHLSLKKMREFNAKARTFYLLHCPSIEKKNNEQNAIVVFNVNAPTIN